MKIYAITKGEYEDYHICTVTSSRAKACELKEMFSDSYGTAIIEEYGENITGDFEGYYYDALEDRITMEVFHPMFTHIVSDNKEIVGAYIEDSDIPRNVTALAYAQMLAARAEKEKRNG